MTTTARKRIRQNRTRGRFAARLSFLLDRTPCSDDDQNQAAMERLARKAAHDLRAYRGRSTA